MVYPIVQQPGVIVVLLHYHFQVQPIRIFKTELSAGFIGMGLARGGTANYIFDGYAGTNPPVLTINYSILRW